MSFKDNEEIAVEKLLSTLADEIQLETISPLSSPMLSFPGLEIRLHQRRVLRDGADVNLTRLEYGTLAYLASSPPQGIHAGTDFPSYMAHRQR